MRATCLVLTLCWPYPVCSAPAPTPRPAKVAAPATAGVVGSWTLTWSGGTGEASLDAEGGWLCEWSGSTYQGSWSLNQGVLTVVEKRVGDDCPLVWSVLMTGPRTGRLSGGGAFSLEPLTPEGR